MTIILTIIVVIITGFVIAGAVCYYKLAIPNMKPLSEEDRRICDEIVETGKGFPLLCGRAVKTGKCACLPCSKLEHAKRQVKI